MSKRRQSLPQGFGGKPSSGEPFGSSGNQPNMVRRPSQQKVERQPSVINKQELIAFFINGGALYYSEKILESFSKNEVYVFFLSNHTMELDGFKEAHDLFIGLMKRFPKWKKFLIADCDQMDGEVLTKARVSHYEHGKCVVADWNAAIDSDVTSGGNSSAGNDNEDNDLFADDSVSNEMNSACDDLAESFEDIKIRREITILILGETGVGKSTWINGLVNYLNYENLKDAENSELITLIPSSFTVTDKSFRPKKVVTGKDTNEDHRAGQSATQSSVVYPFQVDDLLIKIIDTPGIGDVRGVDQDKKNMENILKTLGGFTELHGIVILLKPNNARLTLMFRFCIEELLSHLHNSAIDNIVFGFTNSRGTFYKPGDTFPSLRQLLKDNPSATIPLNKDTIFCFDSESYRFLAALKNGIEFNERDKRAFSESWDRSVTETRRLFARIDQLVPHAIKNTLSLNNARTIIVELTKPMADITNNINHNIAVLEDHIKDVQETKKKGKDLEATLMITIIDLVQVPVTMPRTVCTNSSCVEYRDFEGMKKIHYKTACHDPCYLTGVEINRINNSALTGCDAMGGTVTCRHSNCRHSYADHMHIMYQLDEVSRQIEDKNLRAKMNFYACDADKKQAHVDNLHALIAEYKEEQTEIEATAAKFGAFLKVNAIIPVSDARLEYLDHLIREEKGKVQAGGNPKLLTSLQNSRDAYAQEVKAIVDAMKNGESAETINPSAVQAAVDRLYNLKHFGGSLQNIKDGMVTAFNTHYSNLSKVEIPKPKRRARSFFSFVPDFFKGKRN